ncbi:MAG: MoaD/ThiS family protein [Methanomicrobiales archaeon]|nr:MoaD/ThiS family protein [Methanomicrobiales archaeon]MDD1660096.1 MoaD/ThiS family protein [Methanomicrobiales archaeon]
MRVILRLGGSLAGTGSREREVTLGPGATINTLLESLGLEIPLRPQENRDSSRTRDGALITLVNGRNIEYLEGANTLLAEGDVVAIFLASDGG